MSFHKIKNVEALDNFTLQVLFESGEKRFYDLNKLIEVNKDFEISVSNLDWQGLDVLKKFPIPPYPNIHSIRCVSKV